MEQERPKVFFVAASGNELYDKVKFQYADREKTFVPQSALDLKRALPTLSTGELELRESTIPNAGNGVFAGRDFSQNEIITYYDGPVMTYEAASLLDKKTHHKAIVEGKNYVVVGNRLKDKDKTLITNPREEMSNAGVGAFLNDARDPTKNNVEFLILDMKENQRIWVDMVNSGRKRDPNNKISVRTLMPQFDKHIRNTEKFSLLRRIIVVRALRNVSRGEELFVSYGTGYAYFEDDDNGKKRRPDEVDLREGDGEKRKKCESCFRLTVYIDPLSGLYYCSPECHQRAGCG